MRISSPLLAHAAIFLQASISSTMKAATARWHGLSNSQLFNWRQLVRTSQLVAEDDAGGFVPALIAPEVVESPASGSQALPPQSGATASAPGRMVIILFGAWRDDRGLSDPKEITKPILERYQRHLFYYCKRTVRCAARVVSTPDGIQMVSRCGGSI